ncbi:hypothetical protein [Roseobacter sinensis]|uniref:Secreted protein n=1 Tax=Roseobacter sinensis TaxID=2931391 RepID=A0ABT3BFW0_9RHOB|nr:hypothetical protein [Roseobacter sp. WL0113]MCV3272476.1 hypothetical protein [Roseobacter sp. WL0113]
MTGRMIALGLCVALALVLKFADGPDGTAPLETQQAERPACETPKYWTNPGPGAECYEAPEICPNGGHCDTSPRLWTNAKPHEAVHRL